jgi:hypothetical protein
MLGKIRIAIALLGAAALFASQSAQAEWVKVEPADAGFSMLLPVTPTPSTSEKPSVHNRIWTARVGNLICLMGVTDYDGHINAESELAQDLTNFLKSAQGTATSQQRINFADAPDGPLPALQYKFTRAGGQIGQGLFVSSGDRTYGAIAVAIDGKETPDLARCVTFKITAPSRHWQGQ